MINLYKLDRQSLVLVAALGITCAWLISGCASAPVPNEAMAVAEAAVKQASNTNTSEGAPAELAVAVNKLANARSALAQGDMERARLLAEQASVDAQVAQMHAQATRSVKAARESEDAARVLREEIDRKTNR